jgi:DNA-binding response OmpR family regulator
MIKAVLSHEDLEVVTASSIEDALALVRTDNFDLYVLDRRLPDGTGIELCMRLVEVTPDVHCIFYTGDAYEVHRRQALEAGADEYIAKPDIDALIEGVHRLLTDRDCGH